MGWPVFVSNGPGDEIAPPQPPAPPEPERVAPAPTITLPSAFTPYDVRPDGRRLMHRRRIAQGQAALPLVWGP